MSPDQDRPALTRIKQGIRSFSPRQWRWFLACALLALVATLWLVADVNAYFAQTVSAPGGSLTEGVIGSPRFINPLLAVSDADRDLVALVYSGLMRINPANNQAEPDLAERVEISEDGLTYTFILRDSLRWHDGTVLTANDVAFTITSAQDPLLKSPKRAAWDGVRVEVIDNRTLVLHLKQAYPSLLENATMGLLPKHIWSQLDSESFGLNQFNTESIGSGPYQIREIKKNALGVPEYYDLIPFADFALGQPKIERLRLRFYPSESELVSAYQRGEIEAASMISAANATEIVELGGHIERFPLPRVFGVFFNHNRAPVLARAEVRQALSVAIDREAIISQALLGYGQPASGPLPGIGHDTDENDDEEQTETEAPDRLAQAGEILLAKGWEKNETSGIWELSSGSETIELALVLSTSDTPELKQAAGLIRDTWSALGARTELKIFELGDLNQNVIRPRQYEALFFGEILGRNPDPFAFWHSSQRLDPGLNIALYTNSQVDKILEEARRVSDPGEAQALYERFNELVTSDVPAVFVYSPEFLYIIPGKIRNVVLPTINTAADRFLSIHQWYIKTDRVWPIFANPNNQINKEVKSN